MEIIFSARALIYMTFNPWYIFSDYSSLFIFGILTRKANEKQPYFILGNCKNLADYAQGYCGTMMNIAAMQSFQVEQ